MSFIKVRKYKEPPAFAALDCEGSPRRFRGAVVRTAECWDWLESREEAQRAVDALPVRSVVYCHNLGYDLAVLFGQPFPASLRVRVVGERVISAEWRGHHFADSLGLDPRPLGEIGEDMGLPKLVMPVAEANLESWSMYCARDAEIVYRLVEAVTAWCREHQVSMSSRIGTVAVNAWTRSGSYRDELGPLLMPRAVVGDAEWGRRAMYPGRAEVWREGEHEQVWTYDINAHYANELRGEFPDPRAGYACRVRQARPGFETVTVEVGDSVAGGPLPYRAPGGEIYYPVGRWTGTYTTEELAAAERCGAKVTEFLGGYYYERMILPFASFVDSLYAERLAYRRAGNRVMALAAKRVLNSLWGRLGMEGGHGLEVVRASEWTPAPCGHCRSCRRGGLCWSLVGLRREGPYYLRRVYLGATPDYVNPAWAAWLLSRGRLRLWELMQAAGLGNIVRVHTDSITSTRDWAGGLASEAIGRVKPEYSGPYDCRSVNAYRDDRAHVAGVPRASQDEYYEFGSVTVHRPKGFLEGLASAEVGEWFDTPAVLQATRPSRADGGRRPWTVAEIDSWVQ